MVTRLELRRSAYKSFVIMLFLLITAGALWKTASDMDIIKSGEGVAYYTVISCELVLILLSFLFSLVFFGCVTEYRTGREPGTITLAFSYAPVVLYLYLMGILKRFIYIFLALSVIIVLYVLYSE